jgi:hypothetical protein
MAPAMSSRNTEESIYLLPLLYKKGGKGVRRGSSGRDVPQTEVGLPALRQARVRFSTWHTPYWRMEITLLSESNDTILSAGLNECDE